MRSVYYTLTGSTQNPPCPTKWNQQNKNGKKCGTSKIVANRLWVPKVIFPFAFKTLATSYYVVSFSCAFLVLTFELLFASNRKENRYKIRIFYWTVVLDCRNFHITHAGDAILTALSCPIIIRWKTHISHKQLELQTETVNNMFLGGHLFSNCQYTANVYGLGCVRVKKIEENENLPKEENCFFMKMALLSMKFSWEHKFLKKKRVVFNSHSIDVILWFLRIYIHISNAFKIAWLYKLRWCYYCFIVSALICST